MDDAFAWFVATAAASDCTSPHGSLFRMAVAGSATRCSAVWNEKWRNPSGLSEKYA